MALYVKPHPKCKGVHWNPIGGVDSSVWLQPPILTIGGGFHSNAKHVNYPESCTIG